MNRDYIDWLESLPCNQHRQHHKVNQWMSDWAPLPTEITPLAVLFTEGVKVAVYDVPEARFQLDSAPPLTLTSDSTKSSELCERVNVRVAVSLALREVVSELIAIVG